MTKFFIIQIEMKIRYISIAIISAILFGAATPVSKKLLEDLPVFYLAGFLYLGAGIGMLPFVLMRRKSGIFLRMKGKNMKKISSAVLFGGILGPIFLLFGLQYASAASVSLWLNLELAATALLGHFIFKDHLDKGGWFSVVLTLSAGVLLSFNEGSSGVTAAILVGIACICWGLDNHFTALVDEITPGESTCIKGVAAGSVNIILGYFYHGTHAVSPEIFISAMITGLFAYGISIMLYITSAQNLGATRSQIVFASSPFIGVIFSVILLGESISPLQIAAALIMMVSIILIVRDTHHHFHSHEYREHIHLHRHDDDHHDHDHAGVIAGKPHIHTHVHHGGEHSHPHEPDLHHRHDHVRQKD